MGEEPFTSGVPAGWGAAGEPERGPGWEVLPARTPEGEAVMLLRGIGPAGRARIERIGRSLVDLGRRGAAALPAVLGREGEAWVIERAEELRGGGGRRSADCSAAATGERRACARARDALDAAVSQLHEAGLALGLAPGTGLGVREDGTVVIRDVWHLRPDPDLADRRADQRWIDSVLAEPGRALRRRIDGAGPSASADPAATGIWEGETDGEEDEDEETALRERHVSAVIRSRAWGQEFGRSPLQRFPLAATDPAARDGDDPEELAWGGLVPPPPGREMTGAGEDGDEGEREDQQDRSSQEAESEVGAGARSGGARRDGVRDGVRRGGPRPEGRGRRRRRGRGRRSAMLLVGAGLASAVTTVLLLAAVPGQEAGEAPTARPAATAVSTAPSPAPSSTPIPAPEDPRALVQELASARQQSLLDADGRVRESSERAVTVPGSAAETQDAQIRTAYAGARIQGWSTTVEEAELIGMDARAGTATIRARVAESERTVLTAQGEQRVQPATGPRTVELDLAWYDGTWRILRQRAV